MPTYYPYMLPAGVYNLKVQPNTDGIWYQVATRIEVSAPQPIIGGEVGMLTNSAIVCW
jgi:hypothetical protein